MTEEIMATGVIIISLVALFCGIAIGYYCGYHDGLEEDMNIRNNRK